ncbi:MAG: hypothetical protein AAB676_09775 [Verrucomicrobiota bacterium]
MLEPLADEALSPQEKGAEKLAGVPGELPARLRWIRVPPDVQVRYDQLLTLKADDKPILRRYFQSEPKIAMRRGAVWSLVFLGDESSVNLITNTLGNNTFRPTLDEFDMRGISTMVLGLGFLGRTNDAAYAFLRQGIDPSFWEGFRKWKRENESDDEVMNARLVAYCVGALGVTARPEAKNLIADLQRRKYSTSLPDGQQWRHYEDICAAIAYYEMQERLGWENFQKRFFSRNSGLYAEWGQTESGKCHRRWAWQLRGIPLPPELQ